MTFKAAFTDVSLTGRLGVKRLSAIVLFLWYFL